MANQRKPEYLRASSFLGEESAGTTFFQLQKLVGDAPGEVKLSVYRFIRNDIWQVAVVGDRPPGKLRQEIEGVLAAGESVTIDKPARRWLRQRREQQTQRGPRVEGHYPPGRGFKFGTKT